MVKIIRVNQPIRDMIIKNNIFMGTLSLLLFYKNKNLFCPMPIIFNLQQLPENFKYFKDLNLLCESIPCKHPYGKGLIKQLFYNIKDSLDKAKQGPSISKLIQFIRLDDLNIAIDVSYCINEDSEDITELKLGQQPIIHDEFANVSYAYDLFAKSSNETHEHSIHYYQDSIKNKQNKTVSFQLPTLQK
jgi:hypothetical protein